MSKVALTEDWLVVASRVVVWRVSAVSNPAVVHLLRCGESQGFGFEAGDEMESHVDASRDAGGGDEGALIDPANVFFDGDVGEHGFHVVDVRPMSGGVFAVEEAGLGEEGGAGADAGGELGLCRSGGYPVDHVCLFEFG